MEFKKIVLIHIVAFTQIIEAIRNHWDDGLTIREEDRRASETIKDKEKLQTSATRTRNNYYLPPTYGSNEIGGSHGTHYVGSYTPAYYYASNTGAGVHQGSGHSLVQFGPGSQNPGQFVGHGGGYEYSYGGGVGGHSVKGGYGNKGGYSGLSLKTLLIPLAGIALLGAAAALSTSPVLLELGVLKGRRRRRSVQTRDVYPMNPYIRPD